jgi:eukaryotic-like serine/threonine-protein kinase
LSRQVAALAQDVIVDRYRVLSHLGAGAMGEVWLAEDVGLGRKVALKILSESHRNNPEVRARFIREARAVAAISHPNVVQVFTTGEFDGRPFLAMEYLAGQDLATVVRDTGPIESRLAAQYARDSARGLAAAARAGLIHRDVKPSNLMLLPSGEVKVTDFGLAKPVAPGEDPALTALGVVVGTPDYIAPEQARGDAIDARVDVYALGATLFFLLAGRPPYRKSIDDDEKYLKVVARHLREPVPDPRGEVADVDDELADLQMAMMAKSADARPSYASLIETLEHILARLAAPPVRKPASMSAMVSPPAERTAQVGRPTGTERTQPVAMSRPGQPFGDTVPGGRARASAALVVVTVVSLLIFLTGLGLLLFGPRPERRAVAAPPPADAAVAVVPDAAPVDATVMVETAKPPPEGMLLVQHGVRAPFYVDRAPVSNAEYAQFIAKHKFLKKDAHRPVVGVPYDYALEYARFRKKRLLRADEWDAAIATPSFVPAGMKLTEWVDDRSKGPDRLVRGVNGKSARVKLAGDPTVTFRLAQDVAGW